MPEKDGFSLLRELRAIDSRPVPAIALTALAGPEDRERVRNAGFVLHLTKPVDPGDIVAAVESAARGHHGAFARERRDETRDGQ